MSYPPKVFIYKGPGASRHSVMHLKESLSLFFSKDHIHFLGPKEFLEGEWRKEASLLAMPGGRDLPYVKSLHGRGTDLLRDFVEKGGSYLGICAGAYFAGKAILFDPGPPYGVITGPRELAFFPGLVRGPLFHPYDQRSFLGFRTVPLQWDKAYPWGKESCFVMNGGGFFEKVAHIPEVRVLAAYVEAGKSFPLILHRSYGLGQVVLSQPHVEYVPSLLDSSDPFMAPFIPHLQKTDALRQQCFRHLLELLNSPLLQAQQ